MVSETPPLQPIVPAYHVNILAEGRMEGVRFDAPLFESPGRLAHGLFVMIVQVRLRGGDLDHREAAPADRLEAIEEVHIIETARRDSYRPVAHSP